MNPKITEQHRSRPAYIYVRQSTHAQVLHHQESTERQYALRAMALELGWSESAIRTLDRDLGMTGTEMTRREDFKTLVADVSMGQVGAVFALEVSRLARSNLDWHRLLELCALTATLVIDEDGCYDPSDFNDGLLLGLKGTMAQAELHFLHARLQGGKLNKAKKGELRFPLPVGYCYDEQDRIVPDADEEVRGAVAMVFRLFRETGSAYAVVHRFTERGLRFPKRAYGGAWDGKIIWGRLSHSRVLGVLKNPSYAGMYVFGRYQYRREIDIHGEVHKRMRAVAMSAWRVGLKQHHEGYITLEEFVSNQERLQKNRTNGEETVLSGPAREGLALLQGLLVCGNCGHALTVRYRGNGGIYPTYQCNLLRRGMHHLFMRALHGAAADPVAQPQIFIVVHAPGMLAVVGDEALHLFAQLRRLGPHALQARDDFLHLAGAQVCGDPVDPTAGLLRFLPVQQPGHTPGMLQGVPKIQDFAAPHKHLAPVPDPLGSVTDNHHHGVRRVQPAQFAELGIQMAEDIVGISQATHQKATYHRMASRRGFHPLAGQQQHAGFDLLEMALFHCGQGRKGFAPLPPPALIPHLHAQHAAIHTQHHDWRSFPCGSTFAATVRMVLAQPLAMTGG
jgi:DNA invertase Pin-like site-specific DNA recombinase